MKYCINCGSKIKEDSKFCTNCGYPTKKAKEEIDVKRKEESKEKLLLSLGTILVIVSSIIFAFATWNEMSGILKVLFMFIESLLFLSISLFSKKVNEKLPYKFLWFIGISFIPVIFNLIATEKLLGDYLSYNGNGLYVYLAICSLVSSLVFYLSYKFLKNSIFMFVSHIFAYMMVLFGLYALGLDNAKNINIAFPILAMYNLLICILNNHSKKEKEKKITNAFTSLVAVFTSILTIFYIDVFSKDYFIICTASLTSIITLLYMIYKTNYNFYRFIYTIILYILSDIAIYTIFRQYFSISILFMTLTTILYNFIINIHPNKGLKMYSFILMILNLINTLSFNVGDKTLAICLLLVLIALIFIIKLNDQEAQKYTSIFILPIVITSLIRSSILSFVSMDNAIIFTIASSVMFCIYTVFYEKKKDPFAKSIFEIFAYICLGLSTIFVLFTNVSIIIFILNELLWIYYFVFANVVKKPKAISIILLVLLIINFALCSIKYSISIYYSLLFISIITSILDYIEIKINNKKSAYIYISLAALFLASLYSFRDIEIIGIGLCVISYVLSYYLLVKNHNTHFSVKFLYTLVGFSIIDSLFHHFINNSAIASIFIFVTYLVIVVSMYLLQTDTDRKVLSYSMMPLLEFATVAGNLYLLKPYEFTIDVLLFAIAVFIYFEKVFKLEEKERVIFELIILSIMHLVTITDVIILTYALSAFYIFYSYYKKRDSFLVFGLVILIVNSIFNFFKIFDNITVTYILLIIGVVMLAYVFYIEAKKNNKK